MIQFYFQIIIITKNNNKQSYQPLIPRTNRNRMYQNDSSSIYLKEDYEDNEQVNQLTQKQQFHQSQLSKYHQQNHDVNANKSFLHSLNNQDIAPNNLIFDDTYKNATAKKKYQNNRKYAYYNTLVTLKNNYLNDSSTKNSDKKQVYNHLFQNYDDSNGFKSNNSIHSNNPQQNQYQYHYQPQQDKRLLANKQILHVKKLNKNIFKIDKNKSWDSILPNNLEINNIKFHLHFDSNSGVNNVVGKMHRNTTHATRDTSRFYNSALMSHIPKMYQNTRGVSQHNGRNPLNNNRMLMSNNQFRVMLKQHKKNFNHGNPIHNSNFQPYHKQPISNLRGTIKQNLLVSQDLKNSELSPKKYNQNISRQKVYIVENKNWTNPRKKSEHQRKKSNLLQYLNKMQKQKANAPRKITEVKDSGISQVAIS